MVSISTRLGPKGQIVVPKAFRDEYGFISGEEVLLQDTTAGVLMTKKKIDLVHLAREIAVSIPKNPKGNITHSIYEEYEERWKKSKKST